MQQQHNYSSNPNSYMKNLLNDGIIKFHNYVCHYGVRALVKVSESEASTTRQTKSRHVQNQTNNHNNIFKIPFLDQTANGHY